MSSIDDLSRALVDKWRISSTIGYSTAVHVDIYIIVIRVTYCYEITYVNII